MDQDADPHEDQDWNRDVGLEDLDPASFVCFSHRETFYYANFSFAGEAVFRLYRHPWSRGEALLRLYQRSWPRGEVVFRLYRHSYPLDAGTGEPRPPGWRTAEHVALCASSRVRVGLEFLIRVCVRVGDLVSKGRGPDASPGSPTDPARVRV